MNAIGGQRPYAWAKTWAQDGHEVDVITVTKDTPYNEMRGFQVYEVEPMAPFRWLKNYYRRNLKESSSPLETQSKNGLYSRLKLKGLGTSTRMPDASDFWILPALKKARSLGKKWDLVLTTFGPYSTHVVGWKLKNEGKASKWVADFRDLWTLNPYFTGIPLIKKFEQSIECLLMLSADRITTISEPLAEQMKLLHKSSIVRVIENGADLDELESLEIEKPKTSSTRTILYAGTIYSKRRDPTPLLNAIKEVNDSRVKVLFAGPSSNELKGIISQTGTQDFVEDLGMISRKDALSLQKTCDVLLFLESNAPDAAGVLTGKLFEYLFSGTEIWGVGVDETTLSGQIICQSGAGQVFGVDESKLKEEILRLIVDGSKKVELCEEFRRKFDRKEQARNLINLIKA